MWDNHLLEREHAELTDIVNQSREGARKMCQRIRSDAISMIVQSCGQDVAGPCFVLQFSRGNDSREQLDDGPVQRNGGIRTLDSKAGQEGQDSKALQRKHLLTS